MKTATSPFVMTRETCRLAGTDSVERQETKCLSPVLHLTVVQLLRQAGLTVVTLQWLTAGLYVEFVLVGTVPAASGGATFLCVTVEDFMFTDSFRSLPVLIVTAAADCHLHRNQVGKRCFPHVFNSLPWKLTTCEQAHLVCYSHEYLGCEAAICESKNGARKSHFSSPHSSRRLASGLRRQDTRENNTLNEPARRLGTLPWAWRGEDSKSYDSESLFSWSVGILMLNRSKDTGRQRGPRPLQGKGS